MLESLEIRNFVLIPSSRIEFSDGFSVITGETGSGKSIILSSLALLLGEKSKSDVIRMGEKEASVTGLFSFAPGSKVALWLQSHEFEPEDDTVTIQRIVKENGRSLMYICGRSVTRSELEELGALLIDISSQHEHQSLLKAESQRMVVDSYSRAEAEVARVHEAYSEWRKAEKELAALKDQSAKAEGELDYIRFCLEELEKADLKPGEDEVLQEELKRISSAEALTENVSAAYGSLHGDMGEGVVSLISRTEAALSKAVSMDSSLTDFVSRLENARIECEDVSESLRDYLSSLTFSESELEEKSSRLAQLQRIRRKYGPSLDKAIEKRDGYRERIEAADNSEEYIARAEKLVSEKRAQLDSCCQVLHEKRVKGAKALEKSTIAILRTLGMENAVFEIRIEKCDYSACGTDVISFMICANKGEKLSPVSAVASGGELSRIMLSLKGALAASDEVDTLIFDEVDAGIGGAVANAVAAELKGLGRSHQVVAITHLPQIAAVASSHLLVEKHTHSGRTVSAIREIEGDERKGEIARLLSGEQSEIALEHASRLLGEAEGSV